ncbi:hypothetical protein PUN28_018036 [Cardiocondyla obscurior]|uniref:Uncharacterized protein n=1 Tax=Cardiocondyla obscurior TaxID=286306 RepID=A0AAW2EJD0_9HYME
MLNSSRSHRCLGNALFILHPQKIDCRRHKIIVKSKSDFERSETYLLRERIFCPKHGRGGEKTVSGWILKRTRLQSRVDRTSIARAKNIFQLKSLKSSTRNLSSTLFSKPSVNPVSDLNIKKNFFLYYTCIYYIYFIFIVLLFSFNLRLSIQSSNIIKSKNKILKILRISIVLILIFHKLLYEFLCLQKYKGKILFGTDWNDFQ